MNELKYLQAILTKHFLLFLESEAQSLYKPVNSPGILKTHYYYIFLTYNMHNIANISSWKLWVHIISEEIW